MATGSTNCIWVKVFKNGPSNTCERQPLQILLGPFLNTVIHMYPHFAKNSLEEGLIQDEISRVQCMKGLLRFIFSISTF